MTENTKMKIILQNYKKNTYIKAGVFLYEGVFYKILFDKDSYHDYN